MSQGMLVDRKDDKRFILIFVVVELLGPFHCRDES